MKQNVKTVLGSPLYLAPKCDVCPMYASSVLCGSVLDGNSIPEVKEESLRDGFWI